MLSTHLTAYNLRHTRFAAAFIGPHCRARVRNEDIGTCVRWCFDLPTLGKEREERRQGRYVSCRRGGFFRQWNAGFN